jgi:hypothetical protein
MHAPFPFRNRHRTFLSSPQNGRNEELHSSPSFEFYLHKNLLSPELKTSTPPLLAARSHPSLCRPELQPVWSPEEPLFLSSIHDELPCITAVTRSNSGEFLPSQVHCEPDASHSVQYMHSVHVISHIKMNPNFRKKSKTLHQHPYPFKEILFQSLFLNKFNFRDILKSTSIVWGYQLVQNELKSTIFF